MLVEFYVRERDAQNPYDYIYDVELEATEESTNDDARRRTSRARRETASANPAQIYNPNDVVRLDIHEGARARGSIESATVNVESYYVDEVVEDTDNTDGEKRADDGIEEIESVYMN